MEELLMVTDQINQVFQTEIIGNIFLESLT